MPSGQTLRQLIKSGAVLGSEDFTRAAEQIIHEEREKHHHLLANDLERILYGTRSQPAKSRAERSRPVPRDRERDLPLVELHVPVRSLQDTVLSDENLAVVEELLLEQNRTDLLASYGLRPLNRLLFCGPPGCGKTLTAEVIALELSLELVIVRFDAVVSSFLGETAANLRKVFDFLSEGHFVALFDEFDAIGKERDDAAEHGELKRVVNSVLQMMDSYRGNSVFIAATNHERMLDRAIWRRFDEVLLFEKPTFEQIRTLFTIKLRGVRHDLPLEERVFINEFTGFAHADIERIVIRAIKSMVLRGREFLTSDMVMDAKRREESRASIGPR